MFDRVAKTLCLPAIRVAGSVMLLGTTPAWSQSGQTPVAPANFDPSDVYFQGYLSTRSAEELEAKGDYIGAAEKLKRAREMFEAVRKYYPAWKPEMVQGRSAKTSEDESRIFKNAEEQRKKNQAAVAELEGGPKMSGTFIDPSENVLPLTPPGILEVNPLEAKRLADAEAEVKRLQGLAQKNRALENEASRDESRIRDIARQRDAAHADLRAAEANLQAMRQRLAAKPVETEVKALNQKIASLEQETAALDMALTQSRKEQIETAARNRTLETDLKVMQQKYADLDRDLKAERNVANSVVAGQRAQLQAIEKELAGKTAELAKANERIGSLEKQLQESADAYKQISDERDGLLQERAQMSALLKLNEDGRIQDLIQQNMGLAKNLREAQERVDKLNLESNTSKDDLTIAKRDLSMAKAQINSLHREKREQDGRLAELEKRLKNEENSLNAGQASSNPEEVAVLRDIIQRQLRVQERRRQAKDLLVEAAKDMGSQDERLSKALELFDGQEITLTPEEQSLLAERNADGNFISPLARDRETVGRNTSQLNQDIAVFERTAEKSYAAGRLLPTRELFQMIVEQQPGHVPALCKLGLVHLKLEDDAAAVDTFRRAVELDETNPYAHRMLGLALMKTGDLTAAETEAKIAAELAPDEARNHLLLAGISYRLGKTKEAEGHYKAAISADPMSSDPYYNLAVICSKGKRMDEAKEYYHQALERGAMPDPALEIVLAQP